MNESLQPGQQPSASLNSSSGNKPLWAAVGVLGFAVLAMGGTMLYNQQKPAAAPVVALAAPASLAITPSAPVAPAASASVADDLAEKPPVAAIQPAPVPAPAPVKKVVKHVPKPPPAPRELTYSQVSPGPYGAPATYPVAAAPVPVCAVCGSVESVTPVTRAVKAPTVGVGSIAGGVLGAVLGNQIGHGNGRAAATVLGAVGGGFAGNAIEGQVRKETVYQVGVRMEDGSHRTVEVPRAPGVGAPVTVEGGALRSRDGGVY